MEWYWALATLIGMVIFFMALGVPVAVFTGVAWEELTVSPYGPEWSWVQEIAPPFDIESRSVLAFLDWVSRETGVTIRFADPEVEQLAAATILHGAIEGLTPSEAPAVILPSCRLAATWETTTTGNDLYAVEGETKARPLTHAIRQMLGHRELPEFVGDIGAKGPYRPE